MATTDPAPAILPVDVVTQVLQHVDMHQRMSSCALVSHTWHTAAVAATTSINMRLPAPNTHADKPASLSRWLLNQGGDLTELFACGRLQGAQYPVLNLPFQQLSQLQQLKLRQLQIAEYNATSSGSSSPNWGCLTALTALQLGDVLIATKGFLAHLSGLRDLKRLDLSIRNSNQPVTKFNVDVSRILQQLTAVTSLHLDGASFRTAGLSTLSCLQQLQELKLCSTNLDSIREATVNSLPPMLTSLELHAMNCLLTPTGTPRLGALTNLRHLEVINMFSTQIDAWVLSSLVQLQHLELQNCYLIQAPNDEFMDGTHALFAVLPRLSQLQHLGLYNSIDSMDDFAGDAQQFSALASSSNLTSLNLQMCDLPLGMLKHIFHAGQQRTALKVLQLGTTPGEDLVFINCIVGTDDLEHLASCCPALQELSLVQALQLHVSLTALRQLSGLTQLAVGGPVVTNGAVEEVLVHLTTLQHLELAKVHATYLTAVGLLPLRQLTALTHLVVSWALVHVEGNEEPIGPLDLSSEATPPDVWCQLEERCMCNKSCMPTLLREKAAEAKEAKAQVELLQPQVATLQDELDTARQCIASLQQQLEAEQQQSAALRQQLQQALIPHQ